MERKKNHRRKNKGEERKGGIICMVKKQTAVKMINRKEEKERKIGLTREIRRKIEGTRLG